MNALPKGEIKPNLDGAETSPRSPDCGFLIHEEVANATVASKQATEHKPACSTEEIIMLYHESMPFNFLNERALSPGSNSATAASSSATEKKHRWRRRASVQRLKTCTPDSTLALYCGFRGRAGRITL